MDQTLKYGHFRALKRAAVLIGLALGIYSPAASAQTFVFRIDPTPVLTTSGNVPTGGFASVFVIPGATIKLCTDSACNVRATAYTDATGNTPCAATAPVTLPGTNVCTATAGSQGQFGFWVQPGTYYYTVTTTTGTFGPYPISSPTVGALGGPGMVSANQAGGLVPMADNLDCSVITGASASLQLTACIAALPAAGGVANGLALPATFNSTVTISKSNVTVMLPPALSASAGIVITGQGVNIIGTGKESSVVTYAPGSGGSFIKWANGGSEIFFGSVRDITISGSNNQKKIGIELVDTSNIQIDNVHVNLSGSTNNNEGIKLEGRESTYVRNSYIQADIPLHVSDNPNSTIDCDFLSLINNEWIGPTTGTPAATIMIDSGVNITRWNSIHNAYIGGAGLQQIDTTTVQISEEMNIIGDYCEQQPVATSYCVDIERNNLLYNVHIIGLRAPATTRGIKLRNVRGVHLGNFLYDGTGTMTDIDSSVDDLSLDNVIATSNAATITLTATHKDGCYYQIGAAKPKVCFSEYLTVANGIIGTTTNDNAAAGTVGEYISTTIALGSETNLSNGTPASLGSISLTAGDWDVSGVVQYDFGAMTNWTQLVAATGASNTCAANPAGAIGAPGTFTSLYSSGNVPTAVSDFTIPVPTNRVSIAGTTTVCLIAKAGFSVSTLKGYGFISARRVR